MQHIYVDKTTASSVFLGNSLFEKTQTLHGVKRFVWKICCGFWAVRRWWLSLRMWGKPLWKSRLSFPWGCINKKIWAVKWRNSNVIQSQEVFYSFHSGWVTVAYGTLRNISTTVRCKRFFFIYSKTPEFKQSAEYKIVFLDIILKAETALSYCCSQHPCSAFGYLFCNKEVVWSEVWM